MDPAEVVSIYGASWNEPDAQRRVELLEQAWAPGGVYLDPSAKAEGRDALAAHISGFRSMMPGHSIDIRSGVDLHGNVFRFAWVMRNAAGDVLEGMDYGELADDGRIARIVGFFGPFPEMVS